MAAPRLCRTKSFPGGKPWQVGKGGNLGCVSHTELPAEEFLPCPLPITTPASHGCSGSSRSPVLDLRSHGKVTPPSHFSPEQQKDQYDGGCRGVKASKQHLGLIPTQAGFPELCLASSQQNQKCGFHPFLDTERDRRESTMDAEESRDKESIFLGGTFRCRHEGPHAPQQQPKLCSPKLLHLLLLLSHTSQNTPWDLSAQGTSWNH